MKNFTFIILLCNLFSACENQKKSEQNELTINRDTLVSAVTSKRDIEVKLNYPQKDSVFDYSVVIPFKDDYSLKVVTQLIYDSMFLAEKYYNGGNQVVLSQKLIFKHKDSILNEKIISTEVPNEYKTKVNGKSIRLPKYVLTNILWDSTIGNMSFFTTYSFGLSNSSKEVSSYYSFNGKFLASTNCSRSNCDSIGDINFLKINSNYLESTKFAEVIVFPPQSAGKSAL